MTYQDFLKTKQLKIVDSGFDTDREDINPMMFDYQKDIVQWALKKGRAAVFSDTGTGKTIMQLEWAQKVHEHTGGDILIIAPLNVVKQTAETEAAKFGYTVTACRHQEDVKPGINITNYEMLEHFNASKFVGVVLDESSILKSFTGKYKQMIIDKFERTEYKLSCTATPSPNDHMELGNQCEFLNVMSRTEMLAEYFIHDGGDTSKWRLKGHCQHTFWEWVATWAVCVRKPSDLGYSDDDYVLPKLRIHQCVLETEKADYEMIPMVASTLSERREARRAGLNDRVEAAARMVNESDEQWLVWCDYNDESAALHKAIVDNVEVKGSDTIEHKAETAYNFAKGNVHALVSKPAIYGFGSNWQICHNMIFCGLSDSYEQFYQAIRRCWRYGQKKPVDVWVFVTEREVSVLENIRRKQGQMDEMITHMVENMQQTTLEQIRHTTHIKNDYKPTKAMVLPNFIREAIA